MRINHLLLDIFPHVCQELTTAAAMEEMQLLIQENKSFTKVEAVIKWIKMLFKDNDPLMNLQIDRLIQQIVEKLCARNVTKNTFQLL